MFKFIFYPVIIFIIVPRFCTAQHVLYSDTYNGRISDIEIIGKSNAFYWAKQVDKIKTRNRRVSPDQHFILLDGKMNELKNYVTGVPASSIKQWLVAGSKGLDQVNVTVSGNHTRIFCTRYGMDSSDKVQTILIDSLDEVTNASDLILVRSADQSKILLLAFDNKQDPYTLLHIVLYNADWSRIYGRTIRKEIFAKPFIQDEEIGFPAENFDDLPIKLADNGEWFMAAPSRTSSNFSVFHICPDGKDYFFKEVPVSKYYSMEDLSMCINNEKQELSIGVISAYLKTSLKNIQIMNYDIAAGHFVFDTSYYFNAQAREVTRKNLTHERFMSVPGRGFMYLKEYGAAIEPPEENTRYFNPLETEYLLANVKTVTPAEPVNGYSIQSGLQPVQSVRNRGDLNIFYFPSARRDSTWTGIMQLAQKTMANSPDLSYLLLPSGNKVFVVYNETSEYRNPLANTTTLDAGGKPTGDAIIFWKLDQTLDFQRARRIGMQEVAVPYLEKQQTGFAVIRF